MISLALTLALSLLSFVSSAFVLLRIVVPILPPNPFSRRVPPSEFGLPNYRSLSSADKSHIWLACLDLLALGVFLWQAVAANLLTSTNIIHDPVSAARLWIALTTRQTCLLFVASLALLYVRLGRPVSFGPKHCLLWAPVLVCAATGTGVGTVLAVVGLRTLWGGLVVYSTIVAVATTLCFGCLVGTLLLIRHNVTMAAEAEAERDWPPLKEKPARHSITMEDIEALKEGSSWITSHRSSGSSHRNSISAFSFSTAHHSQPGTTAPITGSAPSLLPKSSYWFGTATPNSAALISQDSIPPVPRVPSPYRDHTTSPPPNNIYNDLPDDPFHRSPPRPSKSSVNSWLTSPSASQVTLTEFSFPTTRPGSPKEDEQLTRISLTPITYDQRVSNSHSPTTTAQPLSESRVLGGYGRQHGLVGLSPKASKDVDVSVFRCVAWMSFIWIPLGLSLPYLLLASPAHDFNSPLASILLTLSVTSSSPLLALNLLLRLPLPIPVALFSPSYSPSKLSNTSPISEIRIHPEMRGRSTSVTVVEGRRSGDVWIANGEAVDGRGKAARVLGLLAPSPRLAVLPPAENKQEVNGLPPPLPIHDESAASIATSSPDVNSVEMGVVRARKDSKASSYWSGADESLAYNSRIMVAQRHYSAMATTVFLPPSPKRTSGVASRDVHCCSVGNAFDGVSVATGVQRGMTKGHARSRSASSSLQTPRSSMQNRFPLTPPPASPLPPTPPNVRRLQHSRSQSSSGSGFSFGPIGHANQIDGLSAGVLPLLVPGLKVGSDMVIRDSPPFRSYRGDQGKVKTPPQDYELGFSSSTSFNSPEMHSTPAKPRKGSGNKRKHLSLPSLGLGKDGIHSLSAWKEELVRVLDGFEAKTPQNRRSLHGGEPPIPTVMLQKTSSEALSPVTEEEQVQFGYAVTSDNPRPASTHTFGVTPPTSASVYSDGFNTARSSMATMVEAQPPTSSTLPLQPKRYDQQDESPTYFRRTPFQTETKYKTDTYHMPVPPVRKSSIVYIKSDDAPDAATVQNDAPAEAQPQKLRPWSTRASVKQYIPRTSKTLPPAADSSPLRKLTLLGNRDLNTSPSVNGTRPLVIKHADKENSRLRPLRLARSATAKARGLLRQNEVLPDVVVRPPSASTHTGFGYTFRQ